MLNKCVIGSFIARKPHSLVVIANDAAHTELARLARFSCKPHIADTLTLQSAGTVPAAVHRVHACYRAFRSYITWLTCQAQASSISIEAFARVAATTSPRATRARDALISTHNETLLATFAFCSSIADYATALAVTSQKAFARTCRIEV